MLDGVFYERPFKLIKGFLQVYLQDHISFLAFHFPKVKNELLDNDDIVSGASIREKDRLTRTNSVGGLGLNFAFYNFSDNFVSSIA